MLRRHHPTCNTVWALSYRRMPRAAYIGNYQWGPIHCLDGAAATGIEADAGVLAMAPKTLIGRFACGLRLGDKR